MPCPSAEDGPPRAAVWPNRMVSAETPTSPAAAGRGRLAPQASARATRIENVDGRMKGTCRMKFSRQRAAGYAHRMKTLLIKAFFSHRTNAETDGGLSPHDRRSLTTPPAARRYLP